jgi:hypothetical protein
MRPAKKPCLRWWRPTTGSSTTGSLATTGDRVALPREKKPPLRVEVRPVVVTGALRVLRVVNGILFSRDDSCLICIEYGKLGANPTVFIHAMDVICSKV